MVEFSLFACYATNNNFHGKERRKIVAKSCEISDSSSKKFQYDYARTLNAVYEEFSGARAPSIDLSSTFFCPFNVATKPLLLVPKDFKFLYHFPVCHTFLCFASSNIFFLYSFRNILSFLNPFNRILFIIILKFFNFKNLLLRNRIDIEQ